MFCIPLPEIFSFFKKIREKTIDKNGEMKKNVLVYVYYQSYFFFLKKSGILCYLLHLYISIFNETTGMLIYFSECSVNKF